MLTITSIFLVFNVFVLAPVFFIGLSHIFSDESFSYKESFVLCFQILLISLFIQALQLAVSYYLPDHSILINVILYLALLLVIIVVIKSKFDTTYPKAILIQVLNVIFAIILAVSYRTFVCQAFKIPAGSNMPTILIGDHILANKYIYRFQPPERNDFIIFKFPKDERIDYIKRVVAIPNDLVEIVNKKLFVNQQPIEEYFTIHPDDTVFSQASGPRDNFGPVTVPEGSYFVLGDNRDNSYDSRFWGFVEKEKIKGKAEVIYFSYNPETRSIRTERIGKTIE
jgi:signal peptidase I